MQYPELRLSPCLKNLLVCLAFLSFSIPLLNAQELTGYTDYNDATILGYLEYLPEGYSDVEEWPLILYLHGLGGRSVSGEADFDLMRNEGLPGRLKTMDIPFVVIAPQVRFTWNDTAENLDAFLDHLLLSGRRIDPSRVYLTGISDGGKGVFDFPLHYRERVAGIVPVSTWPSDSQSVPIATEPFVGETPLPIWGFHGEDDTYAAMKTWLEKVENEGGNVEFTLLPGGHSSVVWDAVYSGGTFSWQNDNLSIYEWLLLQDNPGARAHVPLDPGSTRPPADLGGSVRVAYEGFDLNAGLVEGRGGSTSTGWLDAWISAAGEVSTPGLDYPGLPTTGGALALDSDGNNPSVALRALDKRFAGPEEVWISGLLLIEGSDLSTTSAQFVLNAGLPDAPSMWIGLEQGKSAWGAGGEGLTEVNAANGPAMAIASTDWLVCRLDYGALEGSVWINPPLAGSLPGPQITFSLRPDFWFDQVSFVVQSSLPGHVGWFDELRIGSSFAAVSSPVWRKWPLVEGGYADTRGYGQDRLGWVFVNEPWVYSYGLEVWIYAPSAARREWGMWGYTLKQ